MCIGKESRSLVSHSELLFVLMNVLRGLWRVCVVLPSGGKGGCITKLSFWKRRHHGHCISFILRYFQWKYFSQSKGCLIFPPVIFSKSVQISRSGICSGKILWTWEEGVETFQAEWNYNYWTKQYYIFHCHFLQTSSTELAVSRKLKSGRDKLLTGVLFIMLVKKLWFSQKELSK